MSIRLDLWHNHLVLIGQDPLRLPHLAWLGQRSASFDNAFCTGPVRGNDQGSTDDPAFVERQAQLKKQLYQELSELDDPWPEVARPEIDRPKSPGDWQALYEATKMNRE